MFLLLLQKCQNLDPRASKNGPKLSQQLLFSVPNHPWCSNLTFWSCKCSKLVSPVVLYNDPAFSGIILETFGHPSALILMFNLGVFGPYNLPLEAGPDQTSVEGQTNNFSFFLAEP